MIPILLALMVVFGGVAQADEPKQNITFDVGKLTKETCKPFEYNKTMWEGFIWDDTKNSCYVAVTSVYGESVRVYIDENWKFTDIVRTKGENQ